MNEELKKGDVVRFARTVRRDIIPDGWSKWFPEGTMAVVNHDMRETELICVTVPEARLKRVVVLRDDLELLPALMWR